MRFEHGDGVKMKLSIWKLDNIGYIRSYSGVLNHPEQLFRLKKKLELSKSLVTITPLEKRDDQQAKDAIDTEHNYLTNGSC